MVRMHQFGRCVEQLPNSAEQRRTAPDSCRTAFQIWIQPIPIATSNMMRVTGRCKSDLVTSPHQKVVGLGPRQQPTADTPGVAPAKGTDQSLYSDCSGMCRLRREGLAASSCFKVLYPYFGWLGIPERFEDRLRVVALATLSV